MQLRNRRGRDAPNRGEAQEEAEPVDVNEDVPLNEDQGGLDLPVPVANPLFEQFRRFQQFEAFMNAQQIIPQFAAQPAVGGLQPPLDPGSMVAMAQIRPPTLEGLKVNQIKAFRLAYKRYVSKVPVANWVRLPGQLVLPEQLITISTFNGIGDIDDLKQMDEEQFFRCLCRIHNIMQQ